MKSAIVKRSISIADRKTSVSLEKEFWEALKAIAHDRRVTLSALVGAINVERQHHNLSSAIRLRVLDYFSRKVTEPLEY